jgi:hypothetical protein
MKSNPLWDLARFLLHPSWVTAVYWLLALTSIGIAIYAFRHIEAQRSPRRVAEWLLRFLIGSLWWQETLWKLPPYYGSTPDDPTGSMLYHWIVEIGSSASVPLQADFVNRVVLPHFYFFAAIVYGLEVLTAVSLILGVLVRLWSIIGALQILNMWLGLYNAQGVWPWAYFVLFLLQLMLALHQYGRSLGIDGIIVERYRRSTHGRAEGAVLAALT